MNFDDLIAELQKIGRNYGYLYDEDTKIVTLYKFPQRQYSEYNVVCKLNLNEQSNNIDDIPKRIFAFSKISGVDFINTLINFLNNNIYLKNNNNHTKGVVNAPNTKDNYVYVTVINEDSNSAWAYNLDRNYAWATDSSDKYKDKLSLSHLVTKLEDNQDPVVAGVLLFRSKYPYNLGTARYHLSKMHTYGNKNFYTLTFLVTSKEMKSYEEQTNTSFDMEQYNYYNLSDLKTILPNTGNINNYVHNRFLEDIKATTKMTYVGYKRHFE